eukprot:TRINITY_DN17797_c0_g1_i2.p2 TRINITY_DN17797_c0_g1~~TRINITY_DN17797_c0_g1_i2.p2  ORF type:complete len:104 (+),score=9.55 TRINITY_DN17797_c0_g1_i2:45-314(+)
MPSARNRSSSREQIEPRPSASATGTASTIPATTSTVTATTPATVSSAPPQSTDPAAPLPYAAVPAMLPFQRPSFLSQLKESSARLFGTL